MTVEHTLKQLEALGNDRMRAQNTRNGAGSNQFGVGSVVEPAAFLACALLAADVPA